jgi:CHAT domain-containing protein/tetratricopeptide (TPR) repeat protein
MLSLTLLISALFAPAFVSPDGPPARPQTVGVPTPKADESVERELKGGEAHVYEIDATANQFFRVVVDQRGIDVVVAVFGPDGAKLLKVDRPNGSNGPEELFWMAAKSGKYRLEVRALEQSAPAGKYGLKIVGGGQGTGRELKILTAQVFLSLGASMKAQGTPESLLGAAKSFDSALRSWSEAEELSSAAYAAGQLAQTYRELADGQKASEAYRQALSLHRAAKDRYGELEALKLLGSFNLSTGENRAALDYYQQALALAKSIGSTNGEAVTLNGIGLAYAEVGQYREALPYYEQALRAFRGTGPSRNEATVLLNIAEVYNHLKEFDKSLEGYQKALSMYRASGDLKGEASALNGMGLISANVFGTDKSLEYFKQALALRRKIGDRSGEAVTLLNLGSTYWDYKEYQRSLNYGFQALDIFRTLGDRFGQAKTLHHIGWVYFSMRENKKAVEYLQQALPLFRASGNRDEELSTLNTLARASVKAGDRRQALEYTRQRLPLLKAAGDDSGVASATDDIGVLHSELDEPEKALPYLQSALQLHREAGNRWGEAYTLNALGWVFYVKGDGEKAATSYQAALSIWKTLRDQDWQAKVLYNLAELECSKGNWAEGERLLAETLDLEESRLSAEFLSGAEWEKKAALSEYIRTPQLSISINAQRAPDDAQAARLAMTALLRRKGRVLDSIAEEYSALRRNPSAETAALLDRLNQYVSRQAELKLHKPGNISPGDHEAQINELQEKIEELQLKLNASGLEYRRQGREVTLEAVQRQIPADAALVEFTVWVPFDWSKRGVNMVGKPRYVAYLLFDHGNPQLIDLGDDREISLLAVKLHKLQRQPLAEISEVRRAARELDELVMRPVRRRLGGRTRLLISPEKYLNLVPFAALIDERGRYLINNYRISYLTSGRDLLRLQLARRANDPPLIIANPDFGNTAGRSSSESLPSAQSSGGLLSGMKWPPLPGTESEAQAIKKLLPAANLRVGAEATEAAIKRANAPSVLHFATHGFFLADLPREDPAWLALLRFFLRAARDVEPSENQMLRSGLVLAGANHKGGGEEDGVLTAMEVAGLNLWGTKLVVLSACETGVGDVDTGGGVYGLRRAVVLAGAEAQVMSLWKVDDGVTARLMAEYYTNLLKKNQGRADALREVQLSMLADRNTRHPYYWAGFIESGAWTEVTGLNGTRAQAGK